jgi:hypothetical protein
MNDLLEAIRIAVADSATADQKASAAQACRTILAALEAEAGKPLPPPGGLPPVSPLANIDAGQALDLLIARLRAALPDNDADGAKGARRPAASGPRITLVGPPPGVPWKKR